MATNYISEASPSRHRDTDGFLPLEAYGAIGDGRSVALTGADGAIDWWCVPNMDSPPLFDRLLDSKDGGYFSITPDQAFSVERRYRADSNVFQTQFTTASGRAVLVESLNSNGAGRLPWAELARRIEGVEGEIQFRIEMRLGRQGDTISPYCAVTGGQEVFHVGSVLGVFLHSSGIVIAESHDGGLTGHFSIRAGQQETVAIVAGQDEPLVVPPIKTISGRIDRADAAWREWTQGLAYDGPYRTLLIRSALALKLLLYSPSGAIAAAATTSLPERIGGEKNFDYRYAWVRDAGYTIKAFLRIGAQEEAKAAFSWLLDQLTKAGARVLFALDGGEVPTVTEIRVSGYEGSAPVVTGNAATKQRQHGVYGDIFGTACVFVESGNILDARSAQTLARLADQCADSWRMPDAGIWELEDQQHYTISKLSAWEALARAVELADGGQLPNTCRDRWARERDRIVEWINTEAWSESKNAYVMYPGSDKLDAALALAVRFRFGNKARIRKTLDAIQHELGHGFFHYRYTGMSEEEGCFLACSFWQVEARALLGQQEAADNAFSALTSALNHGVGIYSEMIDPVSGRYLGNLPQGLTHLAMVEAITALHSDDTRGACP